MTRRHVFGLGCAAAALLASGPAEARVAPRRECPHEGCRHHRPGDGPPGICALALRSPTVEEIK